MEKIKYILLIGFLSSILSCNNFFEKKVASVNITTSYSRSIIEPEIQSAALKVSGDDMDDIVASTNSNYFEVLVPIGNDRIFDLEITLKSGIIISGREVADIQDEVSINIVIDGLKADSTNVDSEHITTLNANLGLNDNASATSISEEESLLLKLNNITELHYTIWFNATGEIEAEGSDEFNFTNFMPEVGEHQLTVRVYYLNRIEEETITVTVNSPIRYDNKITSFMFLMASNADLVSDISGVVNDDNTIDIVIPSDFSISDLVADISVSSEATMEKIDASTYKITSKDGVARTYTVNVITYDNLITSFKFLKSDNSGISSDITGTINSNDTIDIVVPSDHALADLIPEINVSLEASLKKVNETTYTVTGKDGVERTYSINVISFENKITSFKFLMSDNSGISADITGTINADNTIDIVVPSGYTLADLTPEITVSADASYTGSLSLYTVKGKDGVERNYTVILTSYDNLITSFKFLMSDNNGISADISGTINSDNTVDIVVPSDHALADLIPEINVSSEASLKKVNETTYTVTGKDGVVRTYSINVISYENKITSFSFLKSDNSGLGADISGTVNSDDTIDILVPSDQTLADLVPAITVSADASYTGSLGSYTVKGKDGVERPYTINVISYDNRITSFKFLMSDNSGISSDITGTINADGTIDIVVPSDHTLVDMIPEITVSTDASYTGSLSSYTVKGKDGVERPYSINVISYENKITSFSILKANNPVLTEDIIGDVKADDTIAVILPSGYLLNDFVVTVNVSSEAIYDVSGNVYTVTGKDNVSKIYTVVASVKPEITLTITSNLDNTLSYVYSETDITMLSSDTRTVTIDLGLVIVDNIFWYMDGFLVAEGKTETLFNIIGSQYSKGPHEVNCIIQKGTELFESPLNVTIQ